MTRRTKLVLAAGAVLLAGAALVVAQSYPDADFNNVTIAATTPLVLGDNTARDVCMSFDSTAVVSDHTLCYDDPSGNMILDIGQDAFGLLGGITTFNFYDTDVSSTVPTAYFFGSYGSPDATDSQFRIGFQINGGSPQEWVKMGPRAGGADATISIFDATESYSSWWGYDGLNGSQFAFLAGAQGYYFDDDIYVDEASPGGVFLKDSGSSCFKCSLSAAQAYTVTNGTTDRAFNANAQCRVVFDATTILAADQYMTQLRGDVNWVRISCNWAGGTTPSVTVTAQECDSAGATCGNMHSAVTCDGGGDSTTTFSDGAANADDWILLDFGTPSGTPGVLTVTLTGDEPTCELADALGSVIADLDTLNILGTSTDRAVSCAAATCPTVTP